MATQGTRRQPPPRPRLRRSSPAPGKGAGSVPGRISGEQPCPGWSRWATAPGSFPPIPWHWTVGISPRGVGLTGRGNSFPLPCLLRSQNSEYLTDPVRVPCRWLPKELAGGPHPARAFGAPPPPPPRGRGQCVAISGKQPYPGWSRWAAAPGSFPPIPMLWTVGISPRGEGPTGRGLAPSPVSHAPTILLLVTATPPAPAALLPAPGEGGGSVLAISGKQPYPGWSR